MIEAVDGSYSEEKRRHQGSVDGLHRQRKKIERYEKTISLETW